MFKRLTKKIASVKLSFLDGVCVFRHRGVVVYGFGVRFDPEAVEGQIDLAINLASNLPIEHQSLPMNTRIRVMPGDRFSHDGREKLKATALMRGRPKHRYLEIITVPSAFAGLGQRLLNAWVQQ